MRLSQLNHSNNIFCITASKSFAPLPIADDRKHMVFDFAYGMTFGGGGEHRSYRSGGQHSRKPGELFADTFQGKMAEFFLYEYFKSKGISTATPDTDQWDLGKWDSCDLTARGRKLNVKSTKSFGNLLLLETKDWTRNAEYIPNKAQGTSVYDFFLLLRIDPFCSDLLKSERLLYSFQAERSALQRLICGRTWRFDIAGWITRDELAAAIAAGHILPQNACLNTVNTRMDAENYYVQAGDMHGIEELTAILKRI